MSYSSEYRLLDVGGTYIKCSDGRQVPVSSDGSREVISAALKKAVGCTDGLKGIGIAIPGPFDFREGIFRMEHKFAAVKGESFRSLAGIPDRIPVKFHHDVNVLLRGAVRMLGLQDKNTALVTLGTGLGFAYALHGEVQYNEWGSPARNLWNLPCGSGILEDLVSARGIRIAYARLTGNGTESAYTIAKKAYAGDIQARQVYDRVGSLLGKAIPELMHDIPLDTVLIGGQIAKSLSLMQRPLQNALERINIVQAPENAVFEGLATLFEE